MGMPMKVQRYLRGYGAIAAVGLLVACGGADVEYNYPRTGSGGVPTYEKKQSVFGEDGLFLTDIFGDDEASSGPVEGVGVNSYLWRASLDTLAFMPLQSADPFGGVIITEWYGVPDGRSERFKVTVYILDRALRSDGIRARVFRQHLSESGAWIDEPANSELDRQLEDTILTRARELRVGSRSR